MLAHQPGTGKAYKASCILIVPFSELGTKSAATRKKMIDQLLTNVKHVLKHVAGIEWTKFRAKPERLVFCFRPGDAGIAMQWLQKVPGILRLHPSVETSTIPVQITTRVLGLVTDGTIRLDSSGIDIKVVGIQDNRRRQAIKHNALLELERLAKDVPKGSSRGIAARVEVHEDFSYILLGETSGMNGFPVGTQNPVVVEIMGRQGDVVAAVLAARRGIVITPIFFDMSGLSTDEGRHGAAIAHARKTIDEFHGFPVKKTVTVRLDSLLQAIDREFPVASKASPCACCLVARRATAGEVVKRLSMNLFVVQGIVGAGKEEKGNFQRTCPVEGSLHPPNLAGLYSLHPLVPRSTIVDEMATRVLGDFPGGDASEGLSWDFCTRRTATDNGIMAQQHVDEIAAFAGEWARKNVEIETWP